MKNNTNKVALCTKGSSVLKQLGIFCLACCLLAWLGCLACRLFALAWLSCLSFVCFGLVVMSSGVSPTRLSSQATTTSLLDSLSLAVQGRVATIKQLEEQLALHRKEQETMEALKALMKSRQPNQESKQAKAHESALIAYSVQMCRKEEEEKIVRYFATYEMAKLAYDTHVNKCCTQEVEGMDWMFDGKVLEFIGVCADFDDGYQSEYIGLVSSNLDE